MGFIITIIALYIIFWFLNEYIKDAGKPTDEEVADAAIYQSMHNLSGKSIREYAKLYREEIERNKKKEKHSESTREFFEEQKKHFDEQQSRFNKTYAEYLKSTEWQKLKFDVYKRDLNRCKQCKKDLSKMNGNVHHTTYANVYNESLDDLELVCKDCHQLIHSYYKHFSPSKKTFPLLSSQQYIEAVELSNKYIDKK